MNFVNVFENIVRWLLWIILKLLFLLVDTLYDVIKAIAYFDILNENVVWTYFSIFISAFLVLFIVIRLSKRYLKTLVDEQEADHFKADQLILKLAAIGLLIVLLPVILRAFGSLLSQLVSKIESIFNIDNSSFSSILINSIPDSNINISEIDSIDITEKVHDKYKYIPSLNMFLCLFIASVFAGYLMLLIGIQLGSRMVSMIMKLIIAPYTLSSLVDEKNDSFSLWWKLFIADIISNYLQMLLLIVGTTLILGFSFNAGNDFTSGLAKDIALIGALFGVINAPSGIAQIFGSDIGLQTAMQNMTTITAGTQIASSAVRLLGGAASFAAAGAFYGGGRLLGGASRGSIASSGIPAMNTISGAISSLGGGFSSGQGNTEGSNSSLDLSMRETPAQQGSLISNRGGALGVGSGGHDAFHNLGNMNIARMVSNYSSSGGNKIVRTAAQVASWGGSKMYAASINRLNSGLSNRNKPQRHNPMHIHGMSYNQAFNRYNPQDTGGNQ